MSAERYLLSSLLFVGPACALASRAHAGPTCAAADGPAGFSDATAETGLDFVHVNGMTGEFFFPEMVGPGGGFVDYDNDGDLDVYLVQGGPLAVSPAPPALGDKLFRNDLARAPDGTTRPAFSDVTDASGIVASGYGMGLATGDFDNDGWTDLYVTNLGPNQLMRNQGDGSFEDVTSRAAVAGAAWSTSAAFFDYDRDGWLDLYVANYVKYEVKADVSCYSTSSARDYCGPTAYEPEPDRLYRNLGNGAFEDVTATALRAARPSPGLGVVTADLDGDGWLDLYVANDGVANQMWVNRTNGTFEDEALFRGAALNWMGVAEASMGVDAGDFDGDGDDDLFMTHLTEETNTLYANDGTGFFEDASLRSGLGAPSLASTGFGTGWIDIDNDGWLDLVIMNGAVRVLEELASRGDAYPLHQVNQAFANRGDGTFKDVSRSLGPAWLLSEVSRGAAFGDLDNDGDTDVLVVNNHGPARLLLNAENGGHHWVGLELEGALEKRDMLGARVEVVTADARVLRRRARTDGSYCSANDPRVLVGLGKADAISAVRIRWPNGQTEEWGDIPVDRYTTLRQGEGRSSK
ncbi:MAG TPA: CRTAC1 family protein [Vicinamibacteria bacterium]|nr:CRTAC1 family protein [Vicinamibacteria bacterium]